MNRFIRQGALSCLLLSLSSVSAVAEIAEAGSDAKPEAIREEVNQGVVSIVAGDLYSTTAKMADDLGILLKDFDGLRVRALPASLSGQSVKDLLYLRGVDLAIVQTNVLEDFRESNPEINLGGLVRYVSKLHNEEIHVLVRDDVRSFEDLRGRAVNFGKEGGAGFVAAKAIFESMNIAVDVQTLDFGSALDLLVAGEIAGLVEVVGKPGLGFKRIASKTADADAGLRLLSLPPGLDLPTSYLPAEISSSDYPLLLRRGEVITTMAVGTALVVYNWDPAGQRYSLVQRFVDAMFERGGWLVAPGRHAKWSEVNLGAGLSGWNRFGPAEAWLKNRELGDSLAKGNAPDGTGQSVTGQSVTGQSATGQSAIDSEGRTVQEKPGTKGLLPKAAATASLDPEGAAQPAKPPAPEASEEERAATLLQIKKGDFLVDVIDPAALPVPGDDAAPAGASALDAAEEDLAEPVDAALEESASLDPIAAASTSAIVDTVIGPSRPERDNAGARAEDGSEDAEGVVAGLFRQLFGEERVNELLSQPPARDSFAGPRRLEDPELDGEAEPVVDVRRPRPYDY